MDDSGGSGGGPTLAEQYGPPMMTISGGGGSGGSMIGGPDGASLAAPGGMEIMKSVTWTISGAIQSQSYTVAQGSTQRLDDPIVHDWGGGSVSYEGVSFYWNENDGNHTVSAAVTYSDGSTTNVSQTVSVGKPTVNSFSVNYTSVTKDPAEPKLTGTIAYNASISMPVSGAGAIDIIQKICVDESIETLTNAGGTRTFSRTSGNQFVCDNESTSTGSSTSGFLWNDPAPSFFVDSGQTVSLNFHTDVPYFSTSGLSNDEKVDLSVNMKLQFIDYLVYNAGGVWVEIAETPSYTLSGSLNWVDASGQPSFDPNNGHWQLDDATTGKTVQGIPTNGLVAWAGYSTAIPKTTSN